MSHHVRHLLERLGRRRELQAQISERDQQLADAAKSVGAYIQALEIARAGGKLADGWATLRSNREFYARAVFTLEQLERPSDYLLQDYRALAQAYAQMLDQWLRGQTISSPGIEAVGRLYHDRARAIYHRYGRDVA